MTIQLSTIRSMFTLSDMEDSHVLAIKALIQASGIPEDTIIDVLDNAKFSINSATKDGARLVHSIDGTYKVQFSNATVTTEQLPESYCLIIAQIIWRLNNPFAGIPQTVVSRSKDFQNWAVNKHMLGSFDDVTMNSGKVVKQWNNPSMKQDSPVTDYICKSNEFCPFLDEVQFTMKNSYHNKLCSCGYVLIPVKRNWNHRSDANFDSGMGEFTLEGKTDKELAALSNTSSVSDPVKYRIYSKFHADMVAKIEAKFKGKSKAKKEARIEALAKLGELLSQSDWMKLKR